MELNREHPGDKVFVRAVGEKGITVAGETYPGPVILSPDSVDSRWQVESVTDLTEEQLKPVLDLRPELVIVGTGAKQIFLHPELMMVFHREGIGIEVMDTRAACRTFNILVVEERRVVAALLPPAKQQTGTGQK